MTDKHTITVTDPDVLDLWADHRTEFSDDDEALAYLLDLDLELQANTRWMG